MIRNLRTKGWLKGVLGLLTVAAVSTACTTKKMKADTKGLITTPSMEKTTFGNLNPSAQGEQALEGREYYLVRGVESADAKNLVSALPGTQFEYGIVKVKITEKEFQLIPVTGNRAFKFSENYAGDVPSQKSIASFPITKHFDIINETNDYGETTNKVIESERRPWYQRKYMRVDWQSPTAGSWTHSAQLAMFGELEETQNEVLEFPKADMSGLIAFRDATVLKNKKASIYRQYMDTILNDQTNAGSRVVFKTYLIPTSAAASDYVPVKYTNTDSARFGFFVDTHVNEIPGRGPEDSRIDRYANLFNICAPNTVHPVTGSIRSCSTAQVVWHLADDFDMTYYDLTVKAVAEWNKTVKAALGRSDDVVVLSEERVSKTDPRYHVISANKDQYIGNTAGIAQWLSDPRTGQIISARANTFTYYLNMYKERIGDMVDAVTEDASLVTDIIGVPNGAANAVTKATSVSTSPKAMISGKLNITQQALGMRLALGLDGFVKNQNKAKVEGALKFPEVQLPASAQSVFNTASSNYGNMNDLQKVAFQAWSQSMVPTEQSYYNRKTLLERVPGLFAIRGDASTPAFEGVQVPSGQVLNANENIVLDGKNGINNLLGLSDRQANAEDSLDQIQSPTFFKTLKNILVGGQARRSLGSGNSQTFDQATLRMVENEFNLKRAEFVEEAIVNYFVSRVQQLQSVGSVAELQAALKAQKATLQEEVAAMSFYKVLLHEMGHTFGLRHNLMGSADRAHYNSEWQRIYGCLADGSSTPGCKVTYKNGSSRPYNYSDLDFHDASTVMDYHGSFIEMDGLGSYDQAAIRYGYVIAANDVPRLTSADASNIPEVKAKYGFCTDEGNGSSIFCAYFDRGHNLATKIGYAIDSYDRSYIRTHFRRDRATFDVGDNLTNTIYASYESMVQIRQVMDEMIYQFIRGGTEANGCPTFIAKSAARGEAANICDGREVAGAMANGLDMQDWSTFVVALSDFSDQGASLKVQPFEYLPDGFADLVYANYLATNFFVDTIGAPEPGDYLATMDKTTKTVTLASLPGNDPFGRNSTDASVIAAKVKSYGMNNDGVTEKDAAKYVNDNVGNVTRIPLGRVGKIYNTYSTQLGTSTVTYNLGFFYDKWIAMSVLGARDLGVLRYREASMAGNAYNWPQSQKIVNALYDKIINDEDKFSSLAVPYNGQPVQAPVPAGKNINLRLLGVITSLSDFVTEQDSSFLGKMNVCTSNDKTCTSGYQLPTATFKAAAGTDTLVASDTAEGDGITYKIAQKGAALSKQRDAVWDVASKKNEVRTQIAKDFPIVQAEKVKLEAMLNAAVSPELKPLVAYTTSDKPTEIAPGKPAVVSAWLYGAYSIAQADSIGAASVQNLGETAKNIMVEVRKVIAAQVAKEAKAPTPATPVKAAAATTTAASSSTTGTVAAPSTKYSAADILKQFDAFAVPFDNMLVNNIAVYMAPTQFRDLTNKIQQVETSFRFIDEINRALSRKQ